MGRLDPFVSPPTPRRSARRRRLAASSPASAPHGECAHQRPTSSVSRHGGTGARRRTASGRALDRRFRVRLVTGQPRQDAICPPAAGSQRHVHAVACDHRRLAGERHRPSQRRAGDSAVCPRRWHEQRGLVSLRRAVADERGHVEAAGQCVLKDPENDDRPAVCTAVAPLDPGRGNLLQFNANFTYQPTNELRAQFSLNSQQLKRHDTDRYAYKINIRTLRGT